MSLDTAGIEALVTKVAAAVAANVQAQIAASAVTLEARVGRGALQRNVVDPKMQMVANAVEFTVALALASSDPAQDLRRYETMLHNVIMEGAAAGRDCREDMESLIQQVSAQWPALSATAASLRIARDSRKRRDDDYDGGRDRGHRRDDYHRGDYPRGDYHRGAPRARNTRVVHNGDSDPCRHCTSGKPPSGCWRLHPELKIPR